MVCHCICCLKVHWVSRFDQHLEVKGSISVHVKYIKNQISILQDKESMTAALQGETFYEGDNPIEENDDSDMGAQQETGSGSISPVSSDSDTIEEEENDGDHQDSGTRKTKACKVQQD